jgi:hypothetical protein
MVAVCLCLCLCLCLCPVHVSVSVRRVGGRHLPLLHRLLRVLGALPGPVPPAPVQVPPGAGVDRGAACGQDRHRPAHGVRQGCGHGGGGPAAVHPTARGPTGPAGRGGWQLPRPHTYSGPARGSCRLCVFDCSMPIWGAAWSTVPVPPPTCCNYLPTPISALLSQQQPPASLCPFAAAGGGLGWCRPRLERPWSACE